MLPADMCCVVKRSVFGCQLWLLLGSGAAQHCSLHTATAACLDSMNMLYRCCQIGASAYWDVKLASRNIFSAWLLRGRSLADVLLAADHATYLAGFVEYHSLFHASRVDRQHTLWFAVIFTIGPSCQDVETLAQILESGGTCARIDLTVRGYLALGLQPLRSGMVLSLSCVTGSRDVHMPCGNLLSMAPCLCLQHVHEVSEYYDAPLCAAISSVVMYLTAITHAVGLVAIPPAKLAQPGLGDAPDSQVMCCDGRYTWPRSLRASRVLSGRGQLAQT